jgi:hypothetical protein
VNFFVGKFENEFTIEYVCNLLGLVIMDREPCAGLIDVEDAFEFVAAHTPPCH